MSTHDRRNRRRRRLGLVGVGAGDGGGLDGFVLPQRADLFGWSAWDATAVDTPTRQVVSGDLGMGYIYSSGASVNASMSVAMLLDAGTYRLDFVHSTYTNRGIYTVTIDGAAAGSFDGYAASGSDNTVSSITGLTLTAGRHTIKWTMASKNASSSAYFYVVQTVTATRTGA